MKSSSTIFLIICACLLILGGWLWSAVWEEKPTADNPYRDSWDYYENHKPQELEREGVLYNSFQTKVRKL
jgi:predicted negative regulator of RcsB-dependent stress response